MSWRALPALAIAIVLAAPTTAAARDLFESDDGEFRLVLRSAFKSTWLLTFPPGDELLGPEDPNGAAFFRLRFDATANLTRYFTTSIAYEHRALGASGASGAGAFLPPNVGPPFRLTPLDWAIVDGAPNYLHRHELDRAFVSMHLPFMELTVGRQAIGLGRGMLFSAIDIFAPFTPLEVDREWRRGVDAIHAELRIPELSALSADFIAAFGDVGTGELASYAMLGRVRAMVGEVDAEVVLGRRGEDNMAGGALSAILGDAAVHGEFAIFGTDGLGIDGGWLGTRAVVAKGLVGGSYMLDIWRGVRVVLEYHYSGFGLANVGRSADLLFDPAFQNRFIRGDTQLLGRHAIALLVSADLFDDISGAITYLQSPVDGSGMVSTAFTWHTSDSLSFLFNAFVPWGAAPEGGVPRSDWGSSPITLLLQARVYD